MDDELIAQFTSITSASTERAQQYLQITDQNLEQALTLYFENDGADLGGTTSSAANTSQPQRQQHEVINLDSDEDEGGGVSVPHSRRSMEDDEAMARRMQEEMYGVGGGGEPQSPGVRAPMARTMETLMGPGGTDWRDDPDEMQAAVLEQLRARRQRPANRPGIFNQQQVAGTIWDEGSDSAARRQQLSRATAGASDASSKTSMLAEMYRPPFEILSDIKNWQDIRDTGKEEEKWILVNVQDPNIFDCQVLNRDVWKNPQVQETVRENFIFKQYNKDDPQAQEYMRYYFQAAESQDAYPHIAIIDPRTGEQVKVWSGIPVPKVLEFLMQVHEFLDRYSLKANTKNPVATRKLEKPKQMDVEKMTEEEMLEMAMRNSLEGGAGLRDVDPDDFTRAAGGSASTTAPFGSSTNGHDSPAAPDHDVNMYDEPTPPPALPTDDVPEPSIFASISSTTPHTEPVAEPATTTRIQFRHPGGRIIRRFELLDPVRRIYEWMKAEPLEGKEGMQFELLYMGRNLLEDVEKSVGDAGLKNGTVMVEFVRD